MEEVPEQLMYLLGSSLDDGNEVFQLDIYFLLWRPRAAPPGIVSSWHQLGPPALLRRPSLWPPLPAPENVRLIHLAGQLIFWRGWLPPLWQYKIMERCRRTPLGRRGETRSAAGLWGFS